MVRKRRSRRQGKVATVCVCPPAPLPRRARRRKRRTNRRRRGGGLSVDPLLHCVYGPVNYVGEGSRVPDGDSEPSVIIEHRSVYTIKPSTNGNITFAIVSSPYGCVGMDEGTVSATVNTANVTTGSFPFPYTAPATISIPFVTQSWGVASSAQYHYSLLPFSESIRLAGELIGNSNQYGLQQSKFRVISTQAKVGYIGSFLNNNGVAATARLSFDMDNNFPQQSPPSLADEAYFQQYGSNLPQQLPDSFAEIAALPTARNFPISESVNMINPPSRFDYQNMKEAWAPFYSTSVPTTGKDTVFGGIMQVVDPNGTATFGVDGVSGMGYAPVTFFAATGLFNTGSPLAIVVETRTCVEYTLAFTSPSLRFASLGPPERPLAIRQVHDLGRLLPSSVPSTPAMESQGWLSKFWEWYWPKQKAGMTLGISEGLRLAGLTGSMGGMSIGGGNSGNLPMLPSNRRLAITY